MSSIPSTPAQWFGIQMQALQAVFVRQFNIKQWDEAYETVKLKVSILLQACCKIISCTDQ